MKNPVRNEVLPSGSAMVAAICSVWSDILGVPTAADDDFWDLGGDSILAAEVGAEMASSLQCKVRLRDFFEYPTPAEMAIQLTSRAS
jgi:acyl carrier protein